MVYYEKNVGIVLGTLVEYQYDQRSLQVAQRCYSELRSYMKSQPCSIFSLGKALDWCETNAKKRYRNQFVNNLYRLADVYVHGKVLDEHLRFLGPLSETWSHDLNEYLDKAIFEYERNDNKRDIKGICKQFCRFAQKENVNSIQNVDYPFLEKYHQYIKSRYKSYSYIEGVVSKFFEFLAGQNRCRRAYSLFIHYIGMGKCTFFNELSAKSRKAIECQCKANRYFSSDQFYSSFPEFIKKLDSAGYSKRIQKSVNYYLTLLYLFLDRADLNYSKVVADAWLEDFGNQLFGGESRKARRIIEMYEDYHMTGDVIPEHWWKHSTTVYDVLPEWCKAEIQHFLAAKRKESCSEDTTVGFKTHLASFCQFLVSENISSFSDITSGIIKKFNIQDRHKTPEGKNLYNRHIRQFLIYLELKQVAPEGLHFALPHCATGGEKIVNVLSQEDRERIAAYCKNASSPLELRDAAILKIGMTTALRGSDIVALKISDN